MQHVVARMGTNARPQIACMTRVEVTLHYSNTQQIQQYCSGKSVVSVVYLSPELAAHTAACKTLAR